MKLEKEDKFILAFVVIVLIIGFTRMYLNGLL